MFLKQFFKGCHKNEYVSSIENDIVSGEVAGSWNPEGTFFLKTS
jgi:hypothetical protein